MPRVSRKGKTTRQTPTASKERVWACAIYARLSLEDSGRKGADTVETQIELVKAYVAGQPDIKLVDVFVDNGVSGKSLDRPAWNRLMGEIKIGRIDCICVKDLSRFSRNYIETWEYLEKIFPGLGIRFISVNDSYDSNIPDGANQGLIIALKSLAGSLYLKDISRKKASSNMARRNRGEFIGSFAPYGYKMSKLIKGKLEPDENTADIVRKIFNLRAEGTSLRKICKELDTLGIPRPSACKKIECPNSIVSGTISYWNPRTVKHIIYSIVYLGHLVYGKTYQSVADNIVPVSVPKTDWLIIENTHEAIVSKDLWDRANSIRMT